jgi:hypothetical protein
MTKSVDLFMSRVLAGISESDRETILKFVEAYPNVLTVRNSSLRDNNILSSSTQGHRSRMHWHRQVRSCKNLCVMVQGASRGVGSVGYKDSNKKRCVKCEMFFPAQKKYGEREYCVCCHSQLRDKPKHHRRDLSSS